MTFWYQAVVLVDMLYLALIFVALGLGYFVFFMIYTRAFNRAKPALLAEQTNSSFVSLLIPFKNEEKNLPALVDGLVKQSLPPERFEVIFCNDFSDDKSKALLEKLTADYDNMQVADNRYSAGKKYALKTALELARADLVVTSDADCRHPSGYLELIARFYAAHEVKLIIAPVKFSHDNCFESYQALDFFSLTGSGYSAALLGKAVMCNGASLAYQKSVFFEFEKQLRFNIKSGDDVFLLHAVKKRYPKQVLFLKNKEASVVCKPQKKFGDLWRQRIRWASKSKAFTDRDTLFLAWLASIINMVLVSSIFLAALFPEYWFLWTASAVLKLVPDFIFLRVILAYFDEKKLLRLFPVAWLVNFLFNSAVFVAILFQSISKTQADESE